MAGQTTYAQKIFGVVRFIILGSGVRVKVLKTGRWACAQAELGSAMQNTGTVVRWGARSRRCRAQRCSARAGSGSAVGAAARLVLLGLLPKRSAVYCIFIGEGHCLLVEAVWSLARCCSKAETSVIYHILDEKALRDMGPFLVGHRTCSIGLRKTPAKTGGYYQWIT